MLLFGAEISRFKLVDTCCHPRCTELAERKPIDFSANWFSDVNSVHVTLNRVNNSWNKLSYHIFHAYRFPMVLCFWLFESVGAVRIASIWPRRPDPLDLNETTPALPSELEVLNKTPRGVIPNTKVKTSLKYLCFIFVVEHSIIVRSLSGVEQ